MSSRATPIAGAPTPEALARALGLHPPTPEQAPVLTDTFPSGKRAR